MPPYTSRVLTLRRKHEWRLAADQRLECDQIVITVTDHDRTSEVRTVTFGLVDPPTFVMRRHDKLALT